MLCPACDDVEQLRKGALAYARALGYASITATPEYKSMYPSVAEAQTRASSYVARAERKRRAGLARADSEADQIRHCYFASLLKEFNRIAFDGRPADEPTCRRCKCAGSSDTWGRHAATKRNPTGRLHRLCPACHELNQRRKAALEQAQARGYASVANTPEYKRIQLEREASQQGRTLSTYLSTAERKRHAEMLRTDSEAHRIRRRYFDSLLLEFNRIERTRPEIMAETRKEDATMYRAYYALNAQQEVARHMAWKAANPERVMQYDENRTGRIKAMDNGTLTVPVIRELKARALRCAYCDNPFDVAREKQTDHVVALCHGGEHSRRNIVIACQRCNGRKARLTYDEWLDRIEPAHHGRAEALYFERYGDAGQAAVGATAQPDEKVGSFVGLVAADATWANVASTCGN